MEMRVRYQRGYLRLGHRKTQPACWEFLWWDNEPTGRRVRRKAVIGTVQQYPNLEDAWQASNGLRVFLFFFFFLTELLESGKAEFPC